MHESRKLFQCIISRALRVAEVVKFLPTMRAVIAFRFEGKRFRFNDDARFLRMHRETVTTVTIHALRMRNENDQMCVTRTAIASRRAIQIPRAGGGNYNAYNTRHLTSSTYNYAIVNRQTFRRIQTRPSIFCRCVAVANVSGNIRVISRANSHIVS